MHKIGTVCGIPAIFGIRWDDIKGKARLKTIFSDTVGYCDDGALDPDTIPAPAIVHQFLKVDDDIAPYMVFFHDDAGEIFGSVVFSAGQIVPMSEVIYENSTDWETAIIAVTHDSNIDFVFFPEGAVSATDAKYRPYEVAKDSIDIDILPKLKKGSRLARILGLIFLILVLIGIGVGVWIYIADPFKKAEEEIQFRVERLKPDYMTVMAQCAVDLKKRWPAPPEWNLAQEGCVITPDTAKVSFPKPVEERPYAYRLYDLESTWNEFLSRLSFLKMAERFPGEVVEGPNHFILLLPYELEKHLVDESYQANTDPSAILRRNFVGIIDISGGTGVGGGLTGKTVLEFDRVVERLMGELLTPNHLYRNLKDNSTGMEISAERIDERQVRIN